MAGDQLTRSIADYMQVDLQTAEQYKREYGEVLFEQLQSQPTFTGQQDTSTFASSGGGFVDFSTQEFATPSPTGSGKMPFDFSTPGDAPTFSTDEHLPQHGTEEVKGTADTGEMPRFNTAEIGGFAVPGANLTGTAEVGGFNIPGSNVTAPITGVPAVPGTGDPTRDALRAQVFNCIAPVLAEIVQEIRRSIEYYQGRANNTHVDEILLTGGTANLKNLAPFIEQETSVRTRVANPLQYVQVSTKNHSPEALNEMASLFSIAIGLGAYSLLGGAKKRR
jgi:type IV pilus assembly protein PilM